MKKYYGNYLGIVVNGSYDDPENRNRVQVWVPHVTNTLYANWNSGQLIDNKGFLNRSIFDIENSNIDDDILERIRNSLPWAECAAPLIGRGSTYYRNEETKRSSINPASDMVPNETNLEDANLDITPENIPTEPAPDVTGDLETLITESQPFSGPLVPVEPPLPTNDDLYENKNSAPPTQNSPAANATGDVSSKTENVIPPPIIKNFSLLERTAKNSARGACIDDGSKGQCLKGASVWAYALTGDERLNKPTGGSAQDIRLGTNKFFQNSGLYRENDKFDPNNYTPVIGDQVLGKNHIITFLGKDSSGKEIWYSDFKDSSPFKYIQSGRWNPNDIVLIRLKDPQNSIKKEFIDDQYYAGFQSYESKKNYENDESTLTEPNGAYTANAPVSNGGYDGTATGTYSSPDVGAKVWVFFMGGDIQKPVYFAMSLNSANYQQTYQSS